MGEDDQKKTSRVEDEEQPNMVDSDDPNSEGNMNDDPQIPHEHEEQLQQHIFQQIKAK